MLVEAGFAIYRGRLEAGYDREKPGLLEERLDQVRASFLSREKVAAELAQAVAARIGEHHLTPLSTEPFHLIDLFGLLAGTPLPDNVSGIVVRDDSGRSIAWEGKTFDLASSGLSRATSGILASRIYRVLWAEAPLSGNGACVQVFSPFDINYPIHSRYLRGGDFEEETTRRFHLLDIDISRGDGALKRARDNDSRLGTAIHNPHGDLLAHMSVQVFSLESRLAKFDHLHRKVRGSILAAILLLLVGAAARWTLSPDAGWKRVAAFAVVALAARVGLHHAGFPAALFPGTSFDPAWFSVMTEAFGLDFGLFHSPGDFLVTGAFGLAAFVLLLIHTRRFLATRLKGEPRLLPGLALAPFALAITTGAVALWLLLLHALTFYSTVDFFPDSSVLPSLPAALILLGLFALTLILALFAGGALYLVTRVSAGTHRRLSALLHLPLFVLITVTLSLATDLSLPLSALAAAALTGSAAVLSSWSALGPGLRLAALTGLVSVLTFPPFIRAVWWEVRADVEEEAQVLFEPGEEESLIPELSMELVLIAEDPWLVSRLMRNLESPPAELAFRLWARSPLSRRPRGVDVVIRDRTGQRDLSRFEIDMPPRSWLPEPLPGASPEQRIVWELPGDGGGADLNFLVGTTPIRSPEGIFIAQLVVRMPAERPALGAPARPAILRPREETTQETGARELHYSEYDGDQLIHTSNPDYPRAHRASEEVRRRILEKGCPSLWIREWIGDAYWMNLYRPRFEDDRITGLRCVSFRSRETRSVFIFFFRLLLLHFLVGLAAVLAWTLITIRRFRARFQHKLLVSYLVVSAVPVMLLAQVNRTVARETVEQQMRGTLRQTAHQVISELRTRGLLDRIVEGTRPGTGPEGVAQAASNETLKEISYRVGQDVNLFSCRDDEEWGAVLVSSSEPGIFATEIFSSRLPGKAYLETVLLGRRFLAAREAAGDYSFLVGYTPILDANQRVAAVVSLPMIYGQDAVDRELARRNSLILAVYLIILVVVVVIGMILARRISSPIERLVLATRRLSAGDFETHIPVRSKDEFGYLVESFNRMTVDLRESRDRLVRAEKDAAWREMAKQIAHEIKNPLTPMRLAAQHVLRAFDDQHPNFEKILSQSLATIIRQTETLKRIAGEFSAFARLPSRPPTPVDVGAIAREVVGLYRGLENVVVVEEIEATPPVLADADELQRVLVNLAANAVEAMAEKGGTLTIRTRLVEPEVEISVSDTGPGIPEENRGRLFEPNFSTKTGGTGLGLAISQAVVTSFGGTIEVRSQVGAGTTMVVRLPQP